MLIVSILIILGIVLFDQVSKLLVVKFLDPSEPFVVIKGIFRFTYVENDGAAFGPGGEGYMRLNVGCGLEVLQDAMKSLKTAIDEY